MINPEGEQLQQHLYKNKMAGIHSNKSNLQALFNAIPIPTLAWQSVDDDFILIDYNDAANIIGKGKIGAALGEKATIFYHDRLDIVENLRCCLGTDVAIEEEISLALRTTGEEKRFAAKYSFLSPDIVLLYTEDITARKLAEEKVITSEAELLALFGAMTDIVLVLDSHGRYIKIPSSNPAFLYQSEHELLGKTLHEVFAPLEADGFLAQIQYALRTKQSSNIEYSLWMNGQEVWFEATISPRRENQVFWIARDVTERKLMYEQLQKNLRRLSVLFEIYRQTMQGFDMEVLIREVLVILQKHLGVDAIAFYLVSEDGQNILLNSSIGLPEKLAVSLKKRVINEGIDSRAILTGIPQLVKLKDIAPSEAKIIAQDHGFTDVASYPLIAHSRGIGTITIANRNERELRGKDQEILMAACSQLGIALHNIQLFGFLQQELVERKRAESIARQSEERYRLLAENIDDVIFTLDLSNRPTYFSLSVMKLLGYTPDEVMELPMENLFTPSSMAIVKGNLQEIHTAIDAGQPLKRERLELEQIRKDGSVVWIEAVVGGLYTSAGTLLGILGVMRDISERKFVELTLLANEEKLHHIAFHHALTGLPNRALFTKKIREKLTLETQGSAQCVLMLIGIKDFKLVNDSFGHAFGDATLIQIARRLLTLVKDGYTVSHISGDEFAILLPGLRTQGESIDFINQIMNLFQEPFVVEGARLHLSANIGSVMYPDQCTNMDELLKNAYIALHQVQISGKGGYCFFDTLLQEEVQRNMTLANDLREAVQKKEFVLYYQPKIEMISGKIVGFEALIRWQHPRAGLIFPDSFIGIAERTGLILPIGEWVLATACDFIRRLRSKGYQDISIAVNISGYQLMQQEFVEDIMKIMKGSEDIPPECLELEITESVLLENVNKHIGKLEELRSMGINISLDDFGTRYSSLSYLKSLPVTILKIDKQFIDDVIGDAGSGAIVEALIQLSHALGLTVVAEGVETVAQRNFLQEKGCDQMQGYLFSRPVPEKEALCLLEHHVLRT